MDNKKRMWNLFILVEFLLLLICVLACHGQGNDILEYTIYEEEGQNQFVGNVKIDSNLASRHPVDVLNQLEFSFRYNTNLYQLFTINSQNGIIKTEQSIDRDDICEHLNTCDIELDITVRPVQYFEIIKVVITVLDINDNTPHFPQSQISRSLAETTNPGALIPIPSAEDNDSGIYGVQRYEIEGDGPETTKFDLRVTDHSDGSMDINIVLLDRLDREEKESYSLTIAAYDGDRNPKAGFLIVDITVTDSNDNNPKFDNNTYETTVYENLPIMTTILRVHATDPDSGEFGEVLYSFAESTPDEYQSVFGLGDLSGEISVKGVIDYEQEKSYQLNIQAKDKGPNSIPAFTRVTINVIDLNDVEPKISVNPLTTSGEAEILENAEKGTFVAHLSVNDPDEDGRQRFDCDIDTDLFELDELSGSNKEYTILTNKVFDREDTVYGYEYEIEVRCTDYGDPQLTDSEHVLVTVLDVNDHTPHFLREHYYVTIPENNSLGYFIMRMVANDEDSGKNADIRYLLQPQQPADQGLVIVDSLSGVVTANTIFDYEKRSSYQYVVIASDDGDSPKSGSAILNITISDVNDEYPIFDMTACNIPVEENRDSGILIETITARDKDDSPFNIIKYSLDRGPQGTGDFHIDESTGELFTNTQLDREVQGVYHLIVIARNNGRSIIRSMLNCTVHVLDVNDNTPIIDYPNERNKTVRISNKLPARYMVTQVIASDPDADRNGQIRYGISNGNEDAYFSMEELSGKVYVDGELEKLKHEIIQLSIVVMDEGEPPRLATEELIIIVDESVAAQTSSGSFLEGNTMIILGVVLAIALILVSAIIAAACIVRKRRESGNKNKHINCKLGTHEALNGSPSSSNHGDSSMNSDTSSNSVKEVNGLDKEMTFTFDDTAYLQKKPRAPMSYSGNTGSPCKFRYSDRPHPHHSDPRKEFELGQYDRSPVHLMPAKTAGFNTRTRLPINKRNSDNITDRSLEHTNDVFNVSNHTDMDSECSGTDSGRGASEEGDNMYASHSINPYPHGHYISREPLGAPLYEVPEHGWHDSHPEPHDQHHGFPSSTKHVVNSRKHNQSLKTEPNLSNTTRLPRVEPVGMFVASGPQRTSTPDQTNMHAHSDKSNNSRNERSFVPPAPKPPNPYTQPQRGSMCNSQTNDHGKITPAVNTVNTTSLKPQTRTNTSEKFELHNGNNTSLYRNNCCDSPKTSLTKTSLEDQNKQNIRPNESQDNGFVNRPPKPVKSNLSIKKAVQFADEVIAKTDISNVRASNVHATPFQEHDKIPLEVRVTEKSKQNTGFYDEMDCLSYSVV